MQMPLALEREGKLASQDISCVSTKGITVSLKVDLPELYLEMVTSTL